MDQGNYEKKKPEEDASSQGNFGAQEVRWVCPECETINTGDKCILCGYQMKQEKAAEAVSSENDTAQGSFGEQESRWVCPECETINTGDKCIVCGNQKKGDEPKTVPEKKRRPKWLWGVIAAVLCVAVGVVLFFATAPARKYKQAYDYLENGEYETAYQMFSELGDYKDSQDMCNHTLYHWGKNALLLKDWETAYTKLSLVEGYPDVDSLLSEIAVETAKTILTSNYGNMAARYADLITLSYGDSLKVFDLIVSQGNVCLADSAGTPKVSAVQVRLTLLDALTVNVRRRDEVIYVSRMLRGLDDGSIETFFRDNLNVIKYIWDYPLTQEIMTYTYARFGVMYGTWNSTDGRRMEFSESDGFSQYGLPTVSSGPKEYYYDLRPSDEGHWNLVWHNETGTTATNVYTITMTDVNTISVYCYKNGATYILYRQ